MIETIESFNPAAVLIPFFEDEGQLYLIFTKRSETVFHHKGQICFPGGGVESGDLSLWHTALRETHEEIGIPPSHIYFIKEIQKIRTPSMFEVTPFVGFVFPKINFNPNPNEIACVITVPFDHFMDKKNVRIEEMEYFGKKFPIPFYYYEGHEIWGATGRIIASLMEVW
ncbi:MAG: CoA pyrophosphatase [Deltaproteobacteria bacterium]|nr:CoA pyrophosphatase [Deltaproteobacteria bacterium]